MHTSRYGLRPRASSASSIEKRPGPAAHLESTPTKHVGSASPHVDGSLPHIELGDALSPQAVRKQDEDVDVDASHDGQAVPSSIEALQVLATVYTEEFSSSTPQDSSEHPSHPPVGDTTSPSTQPPRPRDQLHLLLAAHSVARNPVSILTLFSDNEFADDDVTFRCDSDIAYMSSQAFAAAVAPAACPPAALHAATDARQHQPFVNTSRQPSESESDADVTVQLPTTPDAVRDGSTTMTDVEPESLTVAEAQSTGAFKRPSAPPLRSPVFGAAERPSTPFYSEVSATRTDIRLRHGVSGVVATQSTVYTKEFSSSTPQDSSEDPSHPPDGDTTSPLT